MDREMDASFTNTRESLERANRVPDSHWYGLTRAQKIRSIELEGFVVIPDLLSEELMEEIRRETSRVTTRPTDYSDHQRSRPNLQWTDSPRATSVIALPATVEFLEELFGDELICTSCTYAESRPGHPGIAIHTDSQPYGSNDIRCPGQLALSGPRPLLPGRSHSGVLPVQGDSALPPVDAPRCQPLQPLPFPRR